MCKTLISKYMLAVALLAFANYCRADLVIADSFAEFSGVQGQDGWFYGYYQGTFQPSHFIPMTVFGLPTFADHWVVDYENPPPIYWTYLNRLGGHGNGGLVNFDRTLTEQWAVRRWVSDFGGSVTISGNIADGDTGGPGSNGVVGRVFVGNNERLAVSIADGDTAGFSFSFTETVSLGTPIDFVIDPKDGNSRFDFTRFTATITAVPEPSAFTFSVGVVLVAFTRRTRIVG